MSSAEKYGEESKLEKLARLGVKKSIGVAALAGVGAVLAPPAAAAVLTVVAAGEVVQAALLPAFQERLRRRRLQKTHQ
ncbi:MAG TPA: hypothetical protein VLI54_03915 [Bacillota bacterium]|nr:hypothetical protein [Bacillota bacterium]